MSASVVPTRAARLHLIRQVSLAHHAVELLSSKEAALERERMRLAGHASRTEQRWQEQMNEAARWLLRSRMLGCSEELDRLVETGNATTTIEVAWQSSMGVTYPEGIDCTFASAPVVSSTAALLPTIEAEREALRAAAEHAAMHAAVARLDGELVSTRRRRRAIEDRLLPRLEEQQRSLEVHLDEEDREEALRVRLASSERLAGSR